MVRLGECERVGVGGMEVLRANGGYIGDGFADRMIAVLLETDTRCHVHFEIEYNNILRTISLARVNFTAISHLTSRVYGGMVIDASSLPPTHLPRLSIKPSAPHFPPH